ncbi:MAG TPA: DUF2127 domain-containing protein [Vicinamibacteria bacterium]|nr:DUF2127 domain-containing protein [Vicinamibacteria bacterium]
MLAVIAVFRFLKAVVLVAVALGALRLLDRDTASRAHEWLAALPFVAHHPAVERAAAKVTGASPARLEIAASVGLAYAVLFAVEAVGLWLQRVWAEYLTIVATTSFIPFEVYELTRRFTPIRVGALVANVVIVAYLVARRWHAHRRAVRT